MKIQITRGQAVPERPDLVVSAPSGEYGPFDLIECASVSSPSYALCAYQAQFIQYGNLAYREEEYLKVLEEAGLVKPERKSLAEMLDADGSVVGKPASEPTPVAPPPPAGQNPVPTPVPPPVEPKPKPLPTPEALKPTASQVEVAAPEQAAPVSVSRFVDDLPTPEVQLQP